MPGLVASAVQKVQECGTSGDLVGDPESAASKQSRSEKKARKAMLKLGLKEQTGIDCSSDS